MKKILGSVRNHFKGYLLAGLATLIPIAVTIWVLKFLIVWADGFLKSFIPPSLHPENLVGHQVPGVGIVAILILVLFVGMLTRLYLGKKLLALGDFIFSKIPFGRGIYRAVKEFTSVAFASGGRSLWKVALIEFPKEGSWVIVFVTSMASAEIQKKTGEKVYNVFLPTTPNPTSGYLLMVPGRRLLFLDMNVEDAIRVIMSGGVVQEKAL